MPADGEKKLFFGDDTHWIECTWSAAANGWRDCRKVPKNNFSATAKRSTGAAKPAAKAQAARPAKLETLKKADLIELVRRLL